MEGVAATPPTNNITVKVIFGKTTHDIEISPTETVGTLKSILEKKTGVSVPLQKLSVRGHMLKNDSETLASKNITNGTKLMLIGSSVQEVVAVETAAVQAPQGKEKPVESTREPLSKQPEHKKIIQEGKPEDALPGTKGRKVALPKTSIPGIMTKRGKVRLTFKNDTEELWISSSSSTTKLPYSSIRSISSEPIEGQEDYHIVVLHLGEHIKFYLYWVPAQYVESMKDAILGQFVYF